MLDVRVSDGLDRESLVAFVDRLSATGDGGQPVVAAQQRIARDVRSGEIPAGLRRLAGSLQTPMPPRPRRPADEPETVVSLVGEEALLVLSGADTDELTGTLAGLVRRGLRVVVTATGPDTPDILRRKLPGPVSARTVDGLCPLPLPDLRRLRRLLATATASRQERGAQVLPEPDHVPDPAEIAACCRRAARVVDGVENDQDRVLAEQLRGLDAERRAAVTQVGRCCGRTLGALRASSHEHWLRPLASGLVHNHHRGEFDGLQVLVARQREAHRYRASDPPVTEAATPPADTAETIRGYLDFLESGGRSRTYFRSLAQREAQPVLRAFRVGGDVPQSAEEVAAVVRYLDWRDRQQEIAQVCVLLGAPVPDGPGQLAELADALGVAAAAARSVGALRHDVLFLQQGSPVSVPDLAAAERVARAILDYDEQGDPAEANDELDRLADELAGRVPVDQAAIEHVRAVEALCERDPAAYAEAVDELAAARRENADQIACDELLERLTAAAPELARAWSESPEGGYGLVTFTSVGSLLAELPSPDSADLVLVLGAGALQADALLLTAVAPRMLAVVGDETRAPSSGTTLLEVLNQASARFLRGAAAGETDEEQHAPPVAVPAQKSAAES